MVGKLYSNFGDYLKKEYNGPYVATDIIIRHNDGKKEGIVLIERKYPPFGLSIVGGIAERMRFEDNAVKEAKEETGLDIILDEPTYKPLCVFSKINDDFRAHIASITYTARGSGILKPKEDEDALSAKVYTIKEVEGLLEKNEIWAFERHQKILRIYLEEHERLLKNDRK